MVVGLCHSQLDCIADWAFDQNCPASDLDPMHRVRPGVVLVLSDGVLRACPSTYLLDSWHWDLRIEGKKARTDCSLQVCLQN